MSPSRQLPLWVTTVARPRGRRLGWCVERAGSPSLAPLHPQVVALRVGYLHRDHYYYRLSARPICSWPRSSPMYICACSALYWQENLSACSRAQSNGTFSPSYTDRVGANWKNTRRAPMTGSDLDFHRRVTKSWLNEAAFIKTLDLCCLDEHQPNYHLMMSRDARYRVYIFSGAYMRCVEYLL